ncbi:hypothetical protein D1BOALGB6SA_623 [Olavius sp. associated proteobacterium Delta 1]|nr:hypothetical protein D1BOALGB6SA_623 [Olavius sp. associated proteobacterium Delta 1]
MNIHHYFQRRRPGAARATTDFQKYIEFPTSNKLTKVPRSWLSTELPGSH